MANFNWGTGEQRQNILGNKRTINFLGNKETKRSERADKKLKKKKDIKDAYLVAFFCTSTLFFSICGHGIAAVVEQGNEYEL